MRKLKDQTELSGVFGESISVRKVNGRLVFTNRPKKKRGAPTPKEIAHRERLSEAAQYAKSVAQDDELRALYAARVKGKHESAQSVAIGDFLNPPAVSAIEAAKYRGAIGNIIYVHASDDFQVIKVTITIIDADGVVVEEGEAVNDSKMRVNRWKYKTVAVNPTLKSTRIIAVAYDRPWNVGKREVIV
ncbi:MAG: hypothetical protein HOP08_01375 [Cyclobacteriaceae bacterium]|nr:hypothetical protein [Cyclobacteriaceae bacterium]